MEGFKLDAEAEAVMYHTMSHFWVTGIPEIVSFGRDKSLPTHGADAAGIYNMKDKRIVWFRSAKMKLRMKTLGLNLDKCQIYLFPQKGKAKAKQISVMEKLMFTRE